MSTDGSDERVLADWWGPPNDWIGGHLHSDLVVARNDTGAILAEDIVVYPTGIAFELRALLRPASMFMPAAMPVIEPPDRGAGDAPGLAISFVDGPAEGEFLELPSDRVGMRVEFEDGRRADRDARVGGPGDFTILAYQEGKPVQPDPDANVIFNWSSGSGSPDSMHESCFIWPLPPGDLRLVGSWPDAGLAEQSVVVEHAVIAEASARARPAWRDQS